MEQCGHMVVIGGTSGIGLATALLFARCGGRVTIVGRDQAKLGAALRELGPNAKRGVRGCA